MTEAELQKNVAEDLKTVLEEARTMGCTEVKAFHHIPLKNVAVVVDALEKQIAVSREIRHGDYFCPKCGSNVEYQGYCHACGQRVY